MTQSTGERLVGTSMLRVEDQRFLTGRGKYIADFTLPNMLHVAVLHSPYGHARIVNVDTSALEAMPGVVGILTGEEVRAMSEPFSNLLDPPYDKLEDYCLAVGKVRYVGEPVVAVAAEDKYVARDALELIDVEYEPLEVLTDAEESMKEDAPLVHESVPTNVPWQQTYHWGDPDARFAEADLVVQERFDWHRFTSCPLETVGAAAEYDPRRQTLTIHSNSQRPAMNLPYMARALGIPQERIRLVVPDIGGGFGIKTDIYYYQVLVSLLAMKTGRPVRWIEDRSEHLQACGHGQDIIYDAEMAFKKDGTILALRMRAVHDEGAQMRREPVGAANVVRQPCGPYRFRDCHIDVYTVLTNKCPVGPNRSYGKMQQSFLLERLVDIASRKLGLDPTEVRFKNYIQPEEMPYEQPSGALYDGGDYPQALRRAMEILGYEEAKRERDAARREGRLVGIGFGFGMDSCSINAALARLIGKKNTASGDSEAAWVRMEDTGRVVCAMGTINQGHGHETTITQLLADELGIPPESITVLPGFDSAVHPFTAYSGTYASRFGVVGVGAVLGAAGKLREKIALIAAHLLGTQPEDIELRGGLAVSREREQSIPLTDVARVAWRNLEELPPELEAGLYAHYVFRPPLPGLLPDGRGNYAFTYPYAMGVALVEVDRDTGKVKVRRYISVEDSGNTINPTIVEGQVHGATGHQMGAALYERIQYDEEGQLLTDTFKDYLVPSAADLPPFETESIVTPSLATPLGTRGMGEGGGSGLISVVAAVEDALAPLGITITNSHLHPEELWRAIQEAQTK